MTRRALLSLLLTATAITIVACADEDPVAPPASPDAGQLNLPEASSPTPIVPTPDSGGPTGPVDAGVDAAAAVAVQGYYTGDWGQIMLRPVGDEVWGTYNHDQGTVRGRMVAADLFVGWWCEVPDRMGPTNAGDVEFRFVRGDAGEELRIDGRWLYANEASTTPPWRENWDITRVTGMAPQVLIDRFDDPTVFCPHP